MIVVRDLWKTYSINGALIPALRGVSFEIYAGEFVAIMGPSGSGKTTLMNIIGLLEQPDHGTYQLAGYDTSQLSDDELALMRNRHLGFVFQFFNLIPRLDALHNVEIPMVYSGIKPMERTRRAMTALQLVGLGSRVDHTASQLSGGQQQRVAIARAFVTNPDIIIADEPTGSLDPTTTQEIMTLFQQLNAYGKTIILVTHEEAVARYARRVLLVRDGSLVLDELV